MNDKNPSDNLAGVQEISELIATLASSSVNPQFSSYIMNVIHLLTTDEVEKLLAILRYEPLSVEFIRQFVSQMQQQNLQLEREVHDKLIAACKKIDRAFFNQLK